MTQVYEVQLTEAYEPHATYGMYSTKAKAEAAKAKAEDMLKKDVEEYGYAFYSYVEIEEHYLQ